jgi:hypothetical protein
MDKAEVTHLIEHARSLGLDPGQVLRLRLNFQPIAERYVERPQGTLSMSDAAKKYGLTPAYLLELRREHGLPMRKKSQLRLVDEVKLKQWLKRFPPSNARPGRPR